MDTTEESLQYFSKSCKLGRAKGCAYASILVPGNNRFMWLAKGCALNRQKSCAAVARMYEKGNKEIKRDFLKAARTYEHIFNFSESSTSNGTSSDPCLNAQNGGSGALAVKNYLRSGQPKPAFSLLTKLCSGHRHYSSCHNLGVMAAGGMGVPRNDEAKGWAWYRSCAGGNRYSCYNLGIQFRLGEVSAEMAAGIGRAKREQQRETTEKDGDFLVPETPLDYFRHSCAYGEARGCTNVGAFYSKQITREGRKFFADAEYFLRRGCKGVSGIKFENSQKKRDAMACRQLSTLYRALVPYDEERSLFYLEQACYAGDVPACHEIRLNQHDVSVPEEYLYHQLVYKPGEEFAQNDEKKDQI
eukprot:TRINITY_DN3677_c0_g1_i1.p1 TRINITY_DN3677_c0_g1~~TRINITY_DN3677_c0_g1_i1.p1  ORF type:complete len:358 (-),score=44.71 TRINITY_DN3677_c0_g1_i1:64-1137(-)